MVLLANRGCVAIIVPEARGNLGAMDKFVQSSLASLEPWLHSAAELSTSWLAWRVYAIVAMTIVLALSFRIASAQRNMILELRPQRGPKPRVRKTIERKLRELDEFRNAKFSEAMKRAGLLILFGFVIPSAVLAVAIFYYRWFEPGQDALSVAACPQSSALQPTLLSTGLFLFSQLSMGILNGAAEVFSGPVANYFPNYAPANGVVAAGLVGYRYFIAIFAGVLVHLLGVARKVSSFEALKIRRQELEDALAKATH